MSYKGSNAEWLQKMSLYDLLLLLNESHCVMGSLCEHPNQRCYDKQNSSCEECILSWLNEKRETK